MIDTQEPQTEGWWLERLIKRLASRRDRLELLDRYMRGDPPLPEGTANMREAYRTFQRKCRTNFAALVVDAPADRMEPTGFRTGADGDATGDDEAWRIWQANQLDADSGLVHRTSLALSDAYVIVGPVDDDLEAPAITPEDPRQVYAVHDPIQRRKPIAAVKVFCDDEYDVDRAYLYLPGVVHRAVRDHREGGYAPFDPSGWEWEGDPQPLPANVVPVVRFGNRMDLSGCSMGEFEDAIDILDRINFMILQRLVIASIQAFKQRAIFANLPDLDADGNPVDYNQMFRADPGALWQIPDAEAKIWESGQVDLNGILMAVRHDIQDLAAITRTPLFYLTPDAANGSAEGATLAREGLVFKTNERIKQAGESWEQVMSLAFLFAGDNERASRRDMEVIWADPQRFSLAERYDAAVKAQAAGVPWETTMSSVLQYTPQEITRMRDERATDALLAPQAPAVAPLQPVATGAV